MRSGASTRSSTPGPTVCLGGSSMRGQRKSPEATGHRRPSTRRSPRSSPRWPPPPPLRPRPAVVNIAGCWFIRGAGWLARRSAAVFLAVTVSGLTAGLILHVAGAGGAGDVAWTAAGVCGAGYALWAMAEALRRRRAGVDVIALLAVVGALAVGELLAAAVISVMLASGRALEAWAAGRARRDLRALLERAPRSARRYRDQDRTLETVPLDAAAPGDLLLVAPGELVPVDGTVA